MQRHLPHELARPPQDTRRGQRLEEVIVLPILEYPEEIVSQICESLCLHCQTPDVVDAPYQLVDEARHDQATLANLSLTCRHLRLTAQPILFHYFHNRMVKRPDDRNSLTWALDQERFLAASQFLRSVVSRPDLARKVRALAFYFSPDQACLESLLFEKDTDFFQCCSILGLDHVKVQKFQVPYYRGYPNANTLAIPEALLGLCQNVEQVCIGDVGTRYWHFLEEMGLKELRKLKYIALTTMWSHVLQDPMCDQFAHSRDFVPVATAVPLLKLASRVETLILADFEEGDYSYYSFLRTTMMLRGPPRITLPAVTRLSVGSISPLQLTVLLESLPALEELEYWHTVSGFSKATTHLNPGPGWGLTREELKKGVFSCGFLQPENLASVRSRLRCLCYGTSMAWDAMTPDGRSMRPLGLAGASDLPSLRQLETEHILLTGVVMRVPNTQSMTIPSTAPDICERLPEGLESLKVGTVMEWPRMASDLRKLACLGPERVPNLRNVWVELVYHKPSAEELMELKRFLKTQSNIDLRVTTCALVELGREMMPPRPGKPVEVTVEEQLDLPFYNGLRHRMRPAVENIYR